MDDKQQREIERALQNKSIGELSTRQIAERLGIHRSVVQRVRDLVGDREGVPDMETRRLGADGRYYRVRRIPVRDQRHKLATLYGNRRLAAWLKRQARRTGLSMSDLILDFAHAWAQREKQKPPPPQPKANQAE